MKRTNLYLTKCICILLLASCASPGSVPLSERGLDEAPLVELIDRNVESWRVDRNFSGAILVAKGTRPIYSRAIGLADRSGNRSITLDTPFNLGPMTKVFAAVAVMQLLEEGEVSLIDTVGDYIPDYPNRRVNRTVNIRQLLSHRSGVGDYFDYPEYENAKDFLQSQQDFLSLIIEFDWYYTPNQRYRYSNSGPVILGRIVEIVSGMSYYDYVQANIFQPADMMNSGYFTRQEAISGKATGYVDDAGTTNEPLLGHIGSAAWGSYASANDLLRYTIALKNGVLIRPSTLEEMLEPILPLESGCQYAFLHTICTLDGHRYYSEGPRYMPVGEMGTSARYYWFRDRDIAVIVLSNSSSQSDIDLADRILGWVAYSEI